MASRSQRAVLRSREVEEASRLAHQGVTNGQMDDFRFFSRGFLLECDWQQGLWAFQLFLPFARDWFDRAR
jgi:hypothetical protein